MLYPYNLTLSLSRYLDGSKATTTVVSKAVGSAKPIGYRYAPANRNTSLHVCRGTMKENIARLPPPNPKLTRIEAKALGVAVEDLAGQKASFAIYAYLAQVGLTD